MHTTNSKKQFQGALLLQRSLVCFLYSNSNLLNKKEVLR